MGPHQTFKLATHHISVARVLSVQRLGYGLDDRGSISVKARKVIFLFATASRPNLGPTQSPIQLVTKILYLGIKRSGCETDPSPPPSAEVKNAQNYTSTPPYIFMMWCTGTNLALVYCSKFEWNHVKLIFHCLKNQSRSFSYAEKVKWQHN